MLNKLQCIIFQAKKENRTMKMPKGTPSNTFQYMHDILICYVLFDKILPYHYINICSEVQRDIRNLLLHRSLQPKFVFSSNLIELNECLKRFKKDKICIFFDLSLWNVLEFWRKNRFSPFHLHWINLTWPSIGRKCSTSVWIY